MSGILVIAETRRGELRDVSLELIGAAVEVKERRVGGRLAVAVDRRRRGAVARGARRRGRGRGADRDRAGGGSSRRTSRSARCRS